MDLCNLQSIIGGGGGGVKLGKVPVKAHTNNVLSLQCLSSKQAIIILLSEWYQFID